MGTPRPPGWAERLLALVLPPGERDVVAGELAEAFAARAERDGPARARRWFRRQALGYVLRALSLRRVSPGSTRDGGAAMSRTGVVADMVADLRWAMRAIRRRPSFAVVTVLTLALGIGANAAVFTLVSAHLFQPLPYDRPDELALIWETRRGSEEVNTVAPGNYFAWGEEAASLADIAAFNVDAVTLSGDGPAERLRSSVVTSNFFDVLGVQPLLGPGFARDDGESRAPQVILGHGLWTTRFGGDRSIVGRDIRLDGVAHTVVGILPETYRQPERSLLWQRPELWRSFSLEEQRFDFGSRYLRTVARMAPGVDVRGLRAEMAAVQRSLTERYPEDNAERSVLVFTLDDYLLGSARPTLMLLLGAGLAVLLIVCANVANLTLARGEERRREFAVRMALGSGKARLVRQLMSEGVILAVLGAGVGTAAVYGARGALQQIQATHFTGLLDATVDLRVVLFGVGVAVASGYLFAIPLVRSAGRLDLRASLGEGLRTSEGTKGVVTKNGLIIGQVGIATALLVVAALLGRSFVELVGVPPGFDPTGVVTFTASAPQASYPDTDDFTRYHRELFDRMADVPGVVEVGAISDLMFTTENMTTRIVIEGREDEGDDGHPAELHVGIPEYYAVLDIPVLQGALPQAWELDGEVGAVINQAMADAYWTDESPLGARFGHGWNDGQPVRVVAVVGNVLDDGYSAQADPAFLLPYAGMPRRRMSYLLRAQGDPADLLQAIREEVAALDPDVPAGDLRVLSGMMAETVARPRAASQIGLVIALLALIVASAGIYGVLSYAVTSRTREIGIRTALGASRRQLIGLVLGHSGRLIVAGLVIGIAGALLAGRFISTLLFGVRPWDPVSLLAAVFALGACGFAASWIPARRAVAVQPTEALRNE